MSWIKKFLIYITGNMFAQRILEKNVQVAQFLMGIGSGSFVESSGETAVIEMLSKTYAPPYCIFDVGANQGQYLDVLLHTLPTDKFTIHCFEPGAWVFYVLENNSKHDPRITLNNIALGKEQGERRLYYDQPGSGAASLTQRRLDHFHNSFDQSEIVRVDTLDNYCHENAIDRIHLLKLDVEGHEIDVLAGALKMLRNNAINMIAFEFGGCNIDTRVFFQDFYYMFKEFHMKICRITPSGILVPIDGYKEILEQFRTTNFIAIQG